MNQTRSSTTKRSMMVTLALAMLLSTLAILIGPAAAPAAAATSGSYLREIAVVEGSGTACPDGYSRDGTNFNSDAPGADLYACWDFGDTPEGAITAITPRVDENCPSGQSQRGPDLNKGNDGKKVIICISKGVNSGPPIENVDVIAKTDNFFCYFAKDTDYYNAGRHTYGTADYGVDFNVGAGITTDYVHLCVKPHIKDMTVRKVSPMGSTVIGEVNTWWPPSLTQTVTLSCPSGYGYNVNWTDRSPSNDIYITEVANAATEQRTLIINNPSLDQHRLIIDMACSTYRNPTIPPGTGNLDSGCGDEGQRACTGAVKLSGWRSADWEYNIHQGFSCDRGLIISSATADATCKDLARHDNTAEKDSWETWAMTQQFNVLGADEPINLVPMLQTHNSYNNRADSYPIPNHFRSISDQLDMGTRWLDLRPRWGTGGPTENHLRLSHGNNECSVGCTSVDRPFFYGIEEIATWLDENPNEVLVISTSATEHQVDDDNNAEVLAYLTDPLMKYIGADKILGPREWCDALHPTTSATDCATVPTNSFKGEDYDPSRWPTRDEIRALGAQVMVLGDVDSDVTFGTKADPKEVNYTDGFARQFDEAACTVNGRQTQVGDGKLAKADYLKAFMKVYETRQLGAATSEFEEAGTSFNDEPEDLADGISKSWPGYLYAYADEVPTDNGGNVNRPYAAQASSVEQALNCNLHVQLDMLGDSNRFNGTNDTTNKDDGESHADRRDAMVWTWRSGDYGTTNTCAVMAASDARFESRSCGEAHKIACARPVSDTVGYREGDPKDWFDVVGTTWSVTAAEYTWDRAFEGCRNEFVSRTESGYNEARGGWYNDYFPPAVPAVPTTKQSANALRVASGETDVWLAYTNRRADGQWAIQRTPPPMINYTLTHSDGTDYVAGEWTNKDVVATFTCAVAAGRTKVTDTISPTITLTTEGADQSITPSGTCIDDSGDSSFGLTVGNIDIDKTGPTMGTATFDPVANGSSWYNAPVTISRTCTDALSGVDDPTSSLVVSSEGLGNEATLSCVDRVGNTSSATTTGINVDLTPPSITEAKATTAPGTTGWYRNAVNFTATCADTLSGVTAAPTATGQLAGDGANQSITLVCTDAAGNQGTSDLTGINIDQTAPVLGAATQSPAPNAAGWQKSVVTVSHPCTDATSGPVNATPSSTVTGEGTNLSATVTCYDVAGNSVSATTAGIHIDKTNPVPGVVSVTPAANSYGWRNTDVTVTRACSDTLAGVVRATETKTVSAEGSNVTAALTCSDIAGNTADASVSGIKLDKTKPTIGDATITPAANQFGWQRSDVTVSRPCADALSGPLASSVSTTLTNEGAGLSAALTCTDQAGNTSSKSTTVNLDKTAPVVTYTGQVSAYTILDAVNLRCTATDALSGLASSNCIDINQPAYRFVPGANTVTASATDRADNVTSIAVTFTVDATYAELCTLTQRLMRPGANSTPLCQELTNAEKAEAGGRATQKQQAITNYERMLDDAQKRGDISADNVVVLKKWSQSLLTTGCARCKRP